MLFSCLGLLTWTSFFFQSAAVLVNVTIDDTNPDPLTGRSIIYEPSEAWNGADCQSCTARPSKSQAYNGTWHDSTFNPLPGSNSFPNQTLSATAQFNGTAVHILCILARTLSGPSGNSDMSFYIDGSLVGTFVRPAPGTSGYDYNVTVYSNTSLSPGLHQITIQNGHVNGPKSLLLLDSIVYTAQVDEAHPDRPSTGVIAGAVVGGVAAIVLIAVAAFSLGRRHKRRVEASEAELKVEAFGAATSLPTHNNTHYRIDHHTSQFLSSTNGDPSFRYNSSQSYASSRRVPSATQLGKVNTIYPTTVSGAFDPYYGSRPDNQTNLSLPTTGYITTGGTKAERMALVVATEASHTRPSPEQSGYFRDSVAEPLLHTSEIVAVRAPAEAPPAYYEVGESRRPAQRPLPTCRLVV